MDICKELSLNLENEVDHRNQKVIKKVWVWRHWMDFSYNVNKLSYWYVSRTCRSSYNKYCCHYKFRTFCIFLDIESFINNVRKVKLTHLEITFIDNLYLLTTCSIFGHQIEWINNVINNTIGFLLCYFNVK